MSYYNTTELRGHELMKAIQSAKNQEDKVKMIFELTRKEMTPFEVLDYFQENTPITSIRRAITNLTNENVLINTGKQVKEIYGAINYKWKINK